MRASRQSPLWSGLMGEGQRDSEAVADTAPLEGETKSEGRQIHCSAWGREEKTEEDDLVPTARMRSEEILQPKGMGGAMGRHDNK